MKILSDKLDNFTIIKTLTDLQRRGLISEDVSIDWDKWRTWTPRDRAYGTELQLGTEFFSHFTFPGLTSTYMLDNWGYSYSARALKAASTRRTRNSGGNDYLRYGATWHEYGALIGALYLIDPDARIGMYKNREDFELCTCDPDINHNTLVYHLDRDARVFDFTGYLESELVAI